MKSKVSSEEPTGIEIIRRGRGFVKMDFGVEISDLQTQI